jgi:integrase
VPPRNRRKSKTEGLFKYCKHLDWDRCTCPWWGRYKRHHVSLKKWAGQRIENKDQAKAVLKRFMTAVDAGTFSPRGERPVGSATNQTFSAFLDEYIAKHVEGDGLRSNSTVAYIEVLRDVFGGESVERLSKTPHLIEDWLREQATVRKWSAANYNRYVEHGRAMFNWALRRGLVTANPFAVIELRSASGTRERRITRKQEQTLLDSCVLLDRVPDRARKLTREIVEQVRARVEAGEMQKSVALSLGISAGVVSNIVTGAIWNPNRSGSRAGSEMRRRLVGALDLGLRAGEMLRVQVKHVDYETWKIHLPAAVTKAGTDQIVYAGSDRLRTILTERKHLGPDAYVFGREDGAFVGSFKKAWAKLFTLAGLAVGRKGGYVWHDLRHEYGSSVIEQGATIQEAKELMRHADIRTTERYLKAHERRLFEIAERLGQKRA